MKSQLGVGIISTFLDLGLLMEAYEKDKYSSTHSLNHIKNVKHKVKHTSTQYTYKYRVRNHRNYIKSSIYHHEIIEIAI